MSKHARRPPDAALVALGWGVPWGITLGMWFLAPAILETYRLSPASGAQWAFAILGMSAVFAVLGGFLGVAAGFGLFVLEALTRDHVFGDRVWAYGLLMGVALVLAYGAHAVLIHVVTFGSFSLLLPLDRSVFVVMACCAIASVGLATIYKRVSTRTRRARPAVLVMILAAAAGCGAVVVVGWGAAPAHARGNQVSPIISDGSPGADVPLLFIGVDGATWRLLQPAIESGAAPTLRRLAEHGSTGIITALGEPYWSGAAWASILTGTAQEVTGVYEDLAATAPGLPTFQVPIATTLRLNPIHSVRALLVRAGLIRVSPPPRSLLGAKPVWELLHGAGVHTAVVRFRFTYPPRGQADIVVSDWVGKDQWESLGVRRPQGSETVTPSSEADRLLAPFRPTDHADRGLLRELVPVPRPPKPADMVSDPIQELEIASDIDARTFDVSEQIITAHPREPFMAVYIGGLDTMQHAFWQYRFPEDFGSDRPATSDVERFGPMLDGYVRYLDRRLDELIARYQTEPNIVIVSDHGFGPTNTAAKYRGWHAKDGVFIAAGPSVPRRRDRRDVSYFDVVPTILRLKGFRESPALTGRSVIP